MIVENQNVFPNNVVELVTARTRLLDTDLWVTKRPLRESDPNQSVGVFAAQWLPEENSYEMVAAPVGRPADQRVAASLRAHRRRRGKSGSAARRRGACVRVKARSA